MHNYNLFLAENQTLETERLKLRPVTLRDAEDMFEYASDRNNTYYVFEAHETIDDTRYSIANFFMATPFGKYGIELKDEQKLIGTIDLRVDAEKFSGELGYALNNKYQKNGYMTEAAEALLRLSFETLELEKIYAQCNKKNFASEAVMKRLGMKKEAELRHYMLWKNGEWIDHLQYSILREEYKKK